jgi:serine phosphatase RsbU (regulator of sigma subunit)/streptogramin lyase
LLINEFGWAYKTDEGSEWVFNNRSKDKISLNYSSAKIDPDGYLWIVTNEALRKINIRSGEIVSFKPDPFNLNSILPLDANFFNESTIFLDRQGILWIPDFSQGISRLNLFESYFGLLKDSTGSPVPDVLSALESKDGSFWIGSAADNGGLFHYSPHKKMIKKYYSDSENSYTGRNSPPGRSVSTFLSHPYVFTIAQSNDGFIWTGGGSPGPQMGGVNRIRPGTNQITRFKNDPGDSNSIPGDWVFRILVDSSDRVWVASNNYPDYYAGFCFIDPVTENVTRGLKNPVTGLIDNNPYMPELVTSEGDIIIGNMGLDSAYIIDHKTLEVKPFGMKSPPEGQFYYSEQDDAGRFWFISTAGIGYLDSLHKNVEYFYDIRKNNVPVDEISGLKSDKEGKIWLSSDNGIFQFDPASGKLKHFGFNRGLQGNNYDFRINYKGPSGKIYFGGNGGINIFDPEDINTNPYPPEMVFTDLKLDGRSIKFGEDSAIRKPIFAADKIIVNPEVMTLSIDFSAIHFAGFKDNKYQYKLEGFDKSWIDGGTIGNATYTHLPPGEYSLYIKGSNWDGVWSDGNKSIAIVILPPWWKTWWANVLYALGFIGILGGIRKFELNRRQEKEDKRILELENKRKTDELEHARKLQLSMLPKEIPSVPDFEIAAYMKTATEVGGDYYDFYSAEDGNLTVILGDATGHGLDAGMMVSISKGLFSRLSQEVKLENIINQFNNSLFSMKLQPMYMSGFFIRIKVNYFQIVGAGMPPVLFYQNQTRLVTEIESDGPPLGGFPDYVYKIRSEKLNAGDIVVIMSDGFAERRNISKQLFGWERGREILNHSHALSPQKIIEELIKANDEWGGNREQDDDITIIVIKAK